MSTYFPKPLVVTYGLPIFLGICPLWVFSTSSLLANDTLTRISESVSGKNSNGGSFAPVLSANGRYIAFQSEANNLVAQDENGYTDIFVYDRYTQQIQRVSINGQGEEANFESAFPAISAEGRYVAFQSGASNLVSEHMNGASDIFVHDQNTGQTSLVSINAQGEPGNHNSGEPSISEDGRYVAFHSWADNLVAEDSNLDIDVFLHDLQTGETTMLSVNSKGKQANKASFGPSLSADGRYIAFNSEATNLVEGDTNDITDVYLYERETGKTTRVSVSSQGRQGNDISFRPSLSANGQYIAFRSKASNLVKGDTNQQEDIFVHDQQSGETTLISVNSQGKQANGPSFNATISAEGRYVVFNSDANNLVSDDQNSNTDVFIHDRQTQQTRRLTLGSEGPSQLSASSFSPVISKDNRWIAFESRAWNLVPNDLNESSDIFVYDFGHYADFDVSLSKLHIPLLEVPGVGLYWASLYLVPESHPLQFTLKRTGVVTEINDEVPSSYTPETGVLHLPKLEVLNPPNDIIECEGSLVSDSTLTLFTVTHLNCSTR